ncbi:hypothetical protein PMIN06_011497 [Paraphaeosphaeria minitans]
MFSPTYAYLSTAATETANATNALVGSTSAENTQSNSIMRACNHSRGKSLADCGFNVDYDTKEVEHLAQEIRDGTVAEILLQLFVQWIFQDERNYEEAKKYIRELGVDQDYPLSRITNESVRRVVEGCYELRPEYKAPIIEERKDTMSLLEILQESAIKSSTPKTSLRSRVSLRPSLRKTSLFFPTHSPSFKEEPPLKGTEEKSIIFESHLKSPISSPITPREAGSLLKLKKTPSVTASIGSRGGVATAPRARSQQYPPDTPDRPAPLTVTKSKTTSTLRAETARFVSTPSRTRWVVPLPPDGDSPPPPVPAIPSPSQFTPLSKSKSKTKPRPKYVLIPPRYARQPSNLSPFASKDEDDATIVGSFTTAATKSPDSLLPSVVKPPTNSAASSIYSDTHEPKRFSAFEVTDTTRPVQCRASGYTDTSDDWSTIGDETSEAEDMAQPASLYDSFGFLKEASSPTQDEGIDCFPDTPTQRPPRVDSLPKAREMSWTPGPSKVPPEKRAAAKLARQEAIDGNEMWMRTFDDLPLRRFVSRLDVGPPRVGAPHPPAHPPAPAPIHMSEDEEDDVAAEEGERLLGL